MARSHAERALKLAPQSNQARFARAFSLRFSRETQDESVRLLREEVARQPTNHLVLRILGGTLLRALNRPEQAIVYLDRAAALPGGDPIAQYIRADALWRLGRGPEAEASVDEALAQVPAYGLAHTMKVSLLLDLHGDLPQARAQLAKIPPTFFAEDAGAASAGFVWLYSRDPEKCLQALRSGGEYLRTLNYVGPKAYLSGMAHRLAGNSDAARSDWRAALRVVDQRLAAQPNASLMLWWRAVLLAAVGDRSEAERLLPEIRQRAGTDDSAINALGVARVLVLVGQLD